MNSIFFLHHFFQLVICDGLPFENFAINPLSQDSFYVPLLTVLPHFAPLAHCHDPVLAYGYSFKFPSINAVMLCCIVHDLEILLILL